MTLAIPPACLSRSESLSSPSRAIRGPDLFKRSVASEISVEISCSSRRSRSVVAGFRGGNGEDEEEATGSTVEGEYCRMREMNVSKNWGVVAGYTTAKRSVAR